ncbi:hypothetical protein CHUAL_008785 [Chamberlinius hualienensis]
MFHTFKLANSNSPSMLTKIKEHLEDYWRYWMFILTPIASLPLLICIGTPEAKCAYMVLVMCIYWIFDVIHLAPVSLIPIAFFPLLGLLDSETVCNSYINEANMVFLSSLIAGVALEASGIHKRIALLILLKIGTSPRMLLFGVMLATVLLSTWIMDTAACAIMIPIVDAIMRHLESVDSNCPKAEIVEEIAEMNAVVDMVVADIEDPEERQRIKRMKRTPRLSTIPLTQKTSRFEKCLILSVAYSSAIGGLGTLTGTSTNLVLKELATKMYGKGVGITYATWLMVGLPTTFFCVMGLCCLLQIFALGCRVRKQTPEEKESIKRLILKHYDDLGSMTYHEKSVIIFLVAMILLWFFRSPQFIPGWQDLINSISDVSDSASAYFIIILMCAFPAVWPPPREGGHLVEWETFQLKISWDILFLQGGGFAMATASNNSGLTRWLGRQFMVLRSMPPSVVSYIISLITAFMSEILANSSLAAMLVPVMSDMALQMDLNPMYLMLPVTMASSLAFTLPIATGPNAMVYKTGKLSMRNLVQTGIMANILTVSIMYLLVNTLGAAVFNLNTFPNWAANHTIEAMNATNSTF